jgi:hypothetical protein
MQSIQSRSWRSTKAAPQICVLSIASAASNEHITYYVQNRVYRARNYCSTHKEIVVWVQMELEAPDS